MKPLTCKILLALALFAGLHQAAAQETFFAYFASPASGSYPLTVQFNAQNVDTSENPISGWNWNFGDGSTTNIQNPQHVYTSAGFYLPTVIAFDNHGAEVFGAGTTITVLPPPSPAIGAAPLTVQFSSPSADSKGNAINSWNWDCVTI